MTATLRPFFAVAVLTALAGCASHEGALTAGMAPATVPPKPVEAPVKTQPAKPAAKPIYFRFNPKPGTYAYAQTMSQVSSSGRKHDVELDFKIIITKQADRFQTVGTISRWLVDGATPPDKGPITLSFKLENTLNPHGAVVSAHVTDPTHAFPADMTDLGIAFQLPADPLQPGDTWTMQKKVGGEPLTVSYKFTGFGKVYGRRVAEFEEAGSGANAGNVEQPTIIRVDVKTGLLVEKVSEFSATVGEGADRQVVSSHNRILLQ